MSIHRKVDPHIPPFKVLKVIRTDTDQLAIYKFLLVICSNQGPIAYHFQCKQCF